MRGSRKAPRVADPAVLTAVVSAGAAVLGALTPVFIQRHQERREREAEAEQSAGKLVDSSITSWAELNRALNAEIARLHGDLDRIRRDYEAAIKRQQREHDAAMARQRQDYEGQLGEARQRITDLETDVASLRRLLAPGQGGTA